MTDQAALIMRMKEAGHHSVNLSFISEEDQAYLATLDDEKLVCCVTKNYAAGVCIYHYHDQTCHVHAAFAGSFSVQARRILCDASKASPTIRVRWLCPGRKTLLLQCNGKFRLAFLQTEHAL